MYIFKLGLNTDVVRTEKSICSNGVAIKRIKKGGPIIRPPILLYLV